MTMPVQNADQNSGVYATPANFIDAVKRRYHVGPFAHDFAASRENAKGRTYWAKHDDSLTQDDWNRMVPRGRWGWLNPPYDNIGPWAKKCAEMKQDGGRIFFLVPASTGANWFSDFVWPHAHVILLKGRLSFLPHKPKWLYPKDLILAVYSPEIVGPVMPTIWDWRQP